MDQNQPTQKNVQQNKEKAKDDFDEKSVFFQAFYSRCSMKAHLNIIFDMSKRKKSEMSFLCFACQKVVNCKRKSICLVSKIIMMRL